MLKGFGITGYRSFGPTPQFLHPLEKINLIAGRNNTGKSNTLRIVQLLQQFLLHPQQFPAPSGLDAHMGIRDASFSWRFPLAIDDTAIDLLIGPKLVNPTTKGRHLALIKAILSEFPDRELETVWITIQGSGNWKPQTPSPQSILAAIENKWQSRTVRDAWRNLWTDMTGSSGGSFEQNHGPVVLQGLLGSVTPAMPQVSLLNAHRQIGAPGTPYQGLNGQGLISRLLELQNPELASRVGNLEKFARINSFLAQVLEVKDARLEVPHSGKELNVAIGARVLPIESLGTGVHEVIIFAAAATAVDNEILCIEEPEIHLHPRLQRQLLKYLHEQTDNQYFITTHSACLLDAPGAALFHITLNDSDETEIRRLELPRHRAEVGFDLGYRASDLVQANAIVWVEGPSDRVYLNAWIHFVDPDLSEGLHYSIMFYGGRLLSHLTADDASVTDFINLQRLNRHIAIIIDSDRRNSKDPLNATKNRVLNEIENADGFGWVTAGREMENYISVTKIQSALAEVHPNTAFKNPKSHWDSYYEAESNKNFSADKVAIARAAIASIELDVLDLRVKIESLVKFIRSTNN